MLKRVPVGPDAYELHDEFGKKAINLTSVTDSDGTLRVTATVTGSIAGDIIAGLRLLEVVRSSVQPEYPQAPTPPWVPAAPRQ